ncbi:nucleotidyltransferase domain-containing protein [bacterium]|nr:MAG: nucleotidyltransferase domain-containing protein [bacterium]
MSNEHNQFDTYKKLLLEIIQKHIPGCSIYLFGSRARKTNRSGADIDLAFDCGRIVDFDILLKLRSEIDDTNIPLTVDLVDLHNASDTLKNVIKQEGIIWKA